MAHADVTGSPKRPDLLQASLSRTATVCALGAMALTALLYGPGLKGSFIFDDFPNIVENSGIQVSSLALRDWAAAAWASPSSELQRPLASLSFALNHYFTGLAPAPMKATNLVIHLVNGLLLWLLLRQVLPFDTAHRSNTRTDGLALAVSAAWLLHPINLDAVLFVVQRMESLAQFFVLLGLLFYLAARKRQMSSRPGAGWRLWLAVPLCLLFGVAAKESAALLPLYALALEFTILRGVRRPRTSLLVFYCLFLVLPGTLGLFWMLPKILPTEVWAFRNFTLVQRVLTEPRVLVDYATWTLLPIPDFFSFYHDDYRISTGVFSPWTTLPAVLVLGIAVAASWRLRGSRPLVALGLAWFICAHLLTATIFPLELAFNHRNYFASIGLLLAGFDLVLPGSMTAQLARLRLAAVVATVALAALSLGLRARVWGDPVLLAMTEAAQHPASPRATYDLGRTYVLLSGYQSDSPNLARAVASLETAMRVPNASTLPESALIMVASRTNAPVAADWWYSMIEKLSHRAPTPEDAGAIKSLTLCQREGRCELDDPQMLRVYLAAISHPLPDPAVVYSYAIFAQNRLNDPDLALRLARDAARSSDLQYQINLVEFLIALGRIDEAQVELDLLRRRARPGSIDIVIDDLSRRIADLMRGPAQGTRH